MLALEWVALGGTEDATEAIALHAQLVALQLDGPQAALWSGARSGMPAGNGG